MKKEKILLGIILILMVLVAIPTFAETRVEITGPDDNKCFLQGTDISVTASVYDTVYGQVYNDVVFMAMDRVIEYIKSLQTDNGSFGGYDGHYYLAASLGQAGTDLKVFKTGTSTYVDYLKNLEFDSELSTGDIVKIIYTLASIGENPANFNGKNIVQMLLNRQRVDGSFGAGEFTDAFAVISLNKAGLAIPKSTELCAYFKGLTYEDGLYKGAWGTDIDTTARIVRALKILGEDNNSPIMQNAIAAIGRAQSANGTIESWGASNYDTTAEVVMMLGDLEINPTQGAWDKSGNNLITAILSNQDTDGGFLNAWDRKYSTYEALLALVNYYKAFNTPVNNETPSPQQPSNPSINAGDIVVTVSVIGKDGAVLFPETSVGLTDSDIFSKTALQVLAKTGLAYKTKNDDLYISEIGGLKEDSSSTAGWKYKVNGSSPNVAAKNCILNNGDEVVWFWVGSYTQNQSGSKYVEYKPEEIPASPTLATETYKTVFDDIDDEKYDWAKDEIQYLASKGIIEGTGSGQFEPGKCITREEFIKIVIAMMGEKPKDSTSYPGFKDDAKISVWANPYISRAKELRIIGGYEDGTLRPRRNISRAEMVAILVKALILQKKIQSEEDDQSINLSFIDSDNIDEWARKYVSIAADNNILIGKFGNLFSGNDYAIRAEAAVMVYRATELF